MARAEQGEAELILEKRWINVDLVLIVRADLDSWFM